MRSPPSSNTLDYDPFIFLLSLLGLISTFGHRLCSCAPRAIAPSQGACAYLAYERIPSFRPTFKHYDWRLSLLGAVQCFSMMLYCAPAWYFAVLAIAVAVGVYKYVQSVVGLQAMGRPTPPFWARGKQAHSERVAAYDIEASSSSGGGGGKEGDWRSGRRFLAARESLLSLKQVRLAEGRPI